MDDPNAEERSHFGTLRCIAGRSIFPMLEIWPFTHQLGQRQHDIVVSGKTGIKDVTKKNESRLEPDHQREADAHAIYETLRNPLEM